MMEWAHSTQECIEVGKARQAAIVLGGNGFFQGMFRNIMGFLIADSHFNRVLDRRFNIQMYH